MDFGSHLGSIVAPFSSFVHHFFEYRFCIDFSSILGWFFHRIFIIFRCKTRSATEPREPCFLTTVWCSALIFMFSTSSFFMFFRSFSVSILASFFTYFLTSFAFIFGAQNGTEIVEKSKKTAKFPVIFSGRCFFAEKVEISHIFGTFRKCAPH